MILTFIPSPKREKAVRQAKQSQPNKICMQFVEDYKEKSSHAALHAVIVIAKRATEDGRQLLLAPLRRRLRGRLPLPHRPRYQQQHGGNKSSLDGQDERLAYQGHTQQRVATK